MARVSGYNHFCNDVNGKFGTDQTATGIPISDTHYTIAVPMDLNRTPYRKGDVVLVRNDKNDTSALYLVTDVGGMPHADIDIVEGVGMQALGVEVTAGGGDKGVGAVSQNDGFSTQKVGRFNYRYEDVEGVRPLQELLHEINKGEKQLSALTEIDGFTASLDESAMSQTLASFAPNVVPDVLNKGGHVYGQYDPERRRRTDDDMMGYINQLMQNGEMEMALFMLFAFIVMGGDANKLFGAFYGNNTGPGAGGIGSVGSYEYNNKGVIGGARDGYKYEHPEYEIGEDVGAYLARVAESYVDQRELGNNSGDFVNWLGLNGLPWCAAFTSKVYEGTGLFNFETFALKIAQQGTSTGSYVNGMTGLNNLELGDVVVFDRGTTTDMSGHIGTVVEVEKDASGRVIGFYSVEGNSGDKVSRNHHTLASLAGGDRYLGHVDISHRNTELGANVEQKLLAHYHPEHAAALEKAKQEADALKKAAEEKPAEAQDKPKDGDKQASADIQAATRRFHESSPYDENGNEVEQGLVHPQSGLPRPASDHTVV